MPSATLQTGSSNYELLEFLSNDKLGSAAISPVQATLSGNAKVANIRSQSGRSSTIHNLGIDLNGNFGGGPPVPVDDNRTNIFASVSNFKSSQGNGSDSLNIFGNVIGGNIFTDEGIPDSSAVSGSTAGDDLLRVKGNIEGFSSSRSTIYTDDGDDTIRIGGNVEDTNIFMGNGDDKLDIEGNVENSFISTDGSGAKRVDAAGNYLTDDDGNFLYDDPASAGNDSIRIGGDVVNSSIQTGGGGDTVIIGGLFEDNVNDSSFASIETGSGNDSLVLGGGAKDSQFSTGSGSDTVSIRGNFNNTSFFLGSDSATGDYFSAARNTFFETGSQINSGNSFGDTLIFANGLQFWESSTNLGSGADSLIFGANADFISSTLSTGAGADTIVFGANTAFESTRLDLGGSGNNVIWFNNDNALNDGGLSITGASASDTLLIGAVTYGYDTSAGNFTLGDGTLWSAYSGLM